MQALKATQAVALVLNKLTTQIEQKTAEIASKIAGDEEGAMPVKRKSAFGERRAAKAV